MRALCINGKWNVPTVPCQGLSETGRIPMYLAEEAYKEYSALYGTSQSFARLNERGGFAADELADLLFGRIKRLEGSAAPVSPGEPEVPPTVDGTKDLVKS